MEFWRWQEGIADELWDLALRLPEWPPQSLEQLIGLLRKGTGWLSSRPAKRFSLGLMIDGLRPVAAHLRDATDDFRLFVDAQLLISAQTTHEYTNALYGASALDLPRRGVVHLEGGMGAIGEKLVQAVVNNGGKVLYRQEVERVITERGLPTGVKTKRGGSFPAEAVVINLPPWNIAQLFGTDAPRKLRNLPPLSSDAWGAFMIYVGVDDTVLPADFPLHHQVGRAPRGP